MPHTSPSLATRLFQHICLPTIKVDGMPYMRVETTGTFNKDTGAAAIDYQIPDTGRRYRVTVQPIGD